MLKTKDLKKKIIISEISSEKKIILVSIQKNIKNYETVNLGAKFYNFLTNLNGKGYRVNTDHLPTEQKNFVSYFLHGLKLKSYVFNKYKSKKDNKDFDFLL